MQQPSFPPYFIGVRLCVLLFLFFGGLARPAQAAPIIQEVFYDAIGSDSGDVFNEIFGPSGMSLESWSLVGINGSTGLPYRSIDLTGAVIPNDGLLVLATSSANADLTGFRDFIANVDWQNGPDALQLLDPMATVIDALQYGDAGVNNIGFGAPALDATAGFSLSRDMFATNTGNNLSDFAVGVPSPGVGPLPFPPKEVPEPAALFLLGCGLLSLNMLRRRT